MPTYTNLNKNMRDRLHKVLMRAARMTIDSYCYKKSIGYILGCCKWLDIDEMIKLHSLKFINSLVTTNKPGMLCSKIKFNRRMCANLSFHSFPKTSKWKDTLLYRVVSYYNQLPSDLKYLPSKLFKCKMKSEKNKLKQLAD